MGEGRSETKATVLNITPCLEHEAIPRSFTELLKSRKLSAMPNEHECARVKFSLQLRAFPHQPIFGVRVPFDNTSLGFIFRALRHKLLPSLRWAVAARKAQHGDCIDTRAPASRCRRSRQTSCINSSKIYLLCRINLSQFL